MDNKRLKIQQRKGLSNNNKKAFDFLKRGFQTKTTYEF